MPIPYQFALKRLEMYSEYIYLDIFGISEGRFPILFAEQL